MKDYYVKEVNSLERIHHVVAESKEEAISLVSEFIDNDVDDYVIEAVISYLRVAGVDDQKKEIKGDALKANSKTTVKYNLSPVYDDPGLFSDVVSSRVIIKEEAIQKYYTPKGNEYEVYKYNQSK